MSTYVGCLDFEHVYSHSHLYFIIILLLVVTLLWLWLWQLDSVVPDNHDIVTDYDTPLTAMSLWSHLNLRLFMCVLKLIYVTGLFKDSTLWEPGTQHIWSNPVDTTAPVGQVVLLLLQPSFLSRRMWISSSNWGSPMKSQLTFFDKKIWRRQRFP